MDKVTKKYTHATRSAFAYNRPVFAYMIIASPTLKLLGTVRKLNAEFLIVHICVCLSINSAARCTLNVLSVILPVPPHRYIGIYEVHIWQCHYFVARL